MKVSLLFLLVGLGFWGIAAFIKWRTDVWYRRERQRLTDFYRVLHGLDVVVPGTGWSVSPAFAEAMLRPVKVAEPTVLSGGPSLYERFGSHAQSR
jgi:hypothetical protein